MLEQSFKYLTVSDKWGVRNKWQFRRSETLRIWGEQGDIDVSLESYNSHFLGINALITCIQLLSANKIATSRFLSALSRAITLETVHSLVLRHVLRQHLYYLIAY